MWRFVWGLMLFAVRYGSVGEVAETKGFDLIALLLLAFNRIVDVVQVSGSSTMDHNAGLAGPATHA